MNAEYQGGTFEYKNYIVSIYPICKWRNKPADWAWAAVSAEDATELDSDDAYKSPLAAVVDVRNTIDKMSKPQGAYKPITPQPDSSYIFFPRTNIDEDISAR